MATESIFVSPVLEEWGAEALCEMYEEGMAREKAAREEWNCKYPHGNPALREADPAFDKIFERLEKGENPWEPKREAS